MGSGGRDGLGRHSLPLFTQVSVDSSHRPGTFFGLAIFGTGLGAAFVASQIAALAGVAEEESGLAAGLVEAHSTSGVPSGSRSSRLLPCHAPMMC